MVRILALVITLLITAACGGTPDGGAAPDEPASEAPAAATPDESASDDPSEKKTDVPAKLRFTSTDLDGAAFKGESVSGKPVVLWFWAPWCPKCAAEAPSVKKAADKHSDSVAFLGVPGLSDKPAMKQFVTRHKLEDIPQLPDDKLWKKFGISQQSTFVFMRPDGSTSKASGPLGDADLAEQIAKIVK